MDLEPKELALGGLVLTALVVLSLAAFGPTNGMASTAAPAKSEPESVRQGVPTQFPNDSRWIALEARDRGGHLESHNFLVNDRTTANRFVLVKYAVTNLSQQGRYVHDEPRLVDRKGRLFDGMSNAFAFIPRGGEHHSIGDKLQPGIDYEFWAAFEVPADASIVGVVFYPIAGASGWRGSTLRL